ncbi:MAG: hypothetical protein AAFO69_06280, partial [Bacteroidota bacterium]
MRAIPILFLCLVWLMTACGGRQETVSDPPEAGVPLSLAEERSKQLSDISYELNFKIPAQKDSLINALMDVSFTLKQTTLPVVLDFKEQPEAILGITSEGNPVSYQFVNEHIIINPDDLTVGENEFEIDFVAGDLSLNRNEEFLYTLLVPDRARTLFPVFDQPNLKATYQLTLTIPEGWEAVANGAIVEEVVTGNGSRRVRFSKIEALSSYLFAFAAGKFQKMTDEISGMTMYYRETDTAKVTRNAPEIFELHRQSL